MQAFTICRILRPNAYYRIQFVVYAIIAKPLRLLLLANQKCITDQVNPRYLLVTSLRVLFKGINVHPPYILNRIWAYH